MARNAVSVAIARPPETVFSWLVEPDRLAAWMSGYKGSRPLTEGGLRVGARSIDTLEIDGRRYELEVEVMALDPPHYLACRLAMPKSFEARAVYSLSTEDGATVVHLIQDTEYLNLFGRLMSWIITRSAQKKLEADFDCLKAMVEAS